MKRYFAAIALALLGVAAWRHVSDPAAPQPMPRHKAVLPSASIPAALANPAHATSIPAVQLANALERAPDLRRVFDRYKASGDPAERSAAYRAWSACYPAFIAPAGEPVTLEMVTRALPRNAPDHAERVEAYRSLLGRCKEFFDLDRDGVMAEMRRQKAAWQESRALRSLEQGDVAGAVREARAVIASGDAYAIFSLAGFMERYLKQEREASQPDIRALAFYLAPCELGLECGPDSLTALLLCANRGECEGTVADRYAHSFAGQVDREDVLRESRSVAAAIRAGDLKALGLDR